MLVICDIDGTLADIIERMKIAGEKPDKRSLKKFQNWLDRLQKDELLIKDKPISCMRELLYALSDTHKLIYVTGRCEKYKEVTQEWLDRLHFPKAEVVHRPENDWEDTDIYKERAMLELAMKHQDFTMLVIDDDPEGNCAPMYRKHGWTHLKAMANIEE